MRAGWLALVLALVAACGDDSDDTTPRPPGASPSATAAPNSSGCWVMLAPTSRPPFERPLMPMCLALVHPEDAVGTGSRWR